MRKPLRILIELLPWLLFAYCCIAYLVDPDYYLEVVIAKDSTGGTGVVETMTFVVLLIGITFGIILLIRYWRTIPHPILRAGLVTWVLACVYFAGEEVSWGQWYFQWETPEALAEINKQRETNLHNTSSWLNEKPRTAVEIWLLFAGLLVASARLAGRLRYPVSDVREWINPYSLGISACLVFLISKGLEFGSSEFTQQMSNSEFRELLIAFFLSVYLFSVYWRLKRLRAEKTSTNPSTNPSDGSLG